MTLSYWHCHSPRRPCDHIHIAAIDDHFGEYGERWRYGVLAHVDHKNCHIPWW